MVRKLTREEFIRRSNIIHNNKYNYEKVIYVNNRIKVKIICPVDDHGIFEKSPDSHLYQKSGCTICSGKEKLTFKKFCFRAIKVHGTFYDYSLVNYFNIDKKVKIICPIDGHGIFEQSPYKHIHEKNGCPTCSGNEKLSLEQFKSRAEKIHNGFYDYSLVEYNGMSKKIKIICPVIGHGVFEQSPDMHLYYKNGCPICGGTEKLTFEQFRLRAEKIHPKLYDYSLVDYINMETKVKIICLNGHGIFEQTPTTHLHSESGCSKCSYNKFSKKSIRCLKYLMDNENINIQHAQNGKEYKLSNIGFVDGYCAELNLIIEFHGNIFHGNPIKYNLEDLNPINKKKYGELYQKTLERDKKIRNTGYNLLVIWENEFDEFEKIEKKKQKESKK